MAAQTELQWREPGKKVNQTAHERTSQASTGSREQAHTEPCWRAANVEVRWKKWCVSKNTQSCRQGNRLCKSSPYFLCDYGEKEAKKQNAVPAGGLSQVQPRTTARSPPGRAAHPPYGARALSTLSPHMASSGRCKKMCARKNIQAHQPTAAT